MCGCFVFNGMYAKWLCALQGESGQIYWEFNSQLIHLPWLTTKMRLSEHIETWLEPGNVVYKRIVNISLTRMFPELARKGC